MAKRLIFLPSLALLCVGSLIAPATIPAQTTTAGPNYAGAVGTNGFNRQWTPAGAVGSETAACAASYGTSWSGFWNDFGFAIPSGATIEGIQVELMQAWREDPPGVNSLGVVIGKDEATLATGKTGGAQTLDDDEETCDIYPIDSYGGASDLWGLSWTPAEINSSNFTVRIYNADGSEFGINLNWIRVTVWYTPGDPTISSAASQSFWVGKAPTAVSPLTVTDAASVPKITAANDIRIRIPAGFNMSWDTADLTASISGSASGKVSSTVSYEDAGKTLVLDVTADFAAGDEITISDLSFSDFTATSGSDNLELEVYNDDTVTAEDDKTIEITAAGTPTISSEFDQSFRVGSPPITIAKLTVTDDGAKPVITAANDIRIRIPAGFNMEWDVTDTNALILGTGAAKVSSTVSYEDGGKTLVVDVLTDFAPGDLITIEDLSFANFTAASPDDNLELEVLNDGAVTALDDKLIFIVFIASTPHIASADNQTFTVGDPATAMLILRITDDPVPVITAAGDIRIRIPSGFNMIWDTTDVSPVLSGRGRNNVSSTVSYEDGGKTLVIDVLTDFSSEDWLNVKALSFFNFISASPSNRLRLDIDNDAVDDGVDDMTKIILGPSYGVYVSPDTVAQSRLPSNGTNYTVDFNVSNLGSITDDYDLITSTSPGGVITVVSISGSGISQGANPDSARMAGVVPAETRTATVTYSVADVALGTTDTLFFLARSVGSPAFSDTVRLELIVVRPDILTNKAVNPSGTQVPGTDLTYTITVTNNGTEEAVNLVNVDSLATEVDFKVGSVVNNFPAGIGVTVEYSNDNAATWTYTPVSQGCAAPIDYDACVTHIRWTLQNNLPYTAPDNTGDVQFVARIR